MQAFFRSSVMQLFCLDFGFLTSSLSQPRHDSDVLLLHLSINIFVVSVETGCFIFRYGVERVEECLECSQNQESRR